MRVKRFSLLAFESVTAWDLIDITELFSCVYTFPRENYQFNNALIHRRANNLLFSNDNLCVPGKKSISVKKAEIRRLCGRWKKIPSAMRSATTTTTTAARHLRNYAWWIDDFLKQHTLKVTRYNIAVFVFWKALAVNSNWPVCATTATSATDLIPLFMPDLQSVVEKKEKRYIVEEAFRLFRALPVEARKKVFYVFFVFFASFLWRDVFGEVSSGRVIVRFKSTEKLHLPRLRVVTRQLLQHGVMCTWRITNWSKERKSLLFRWFRKRDASFFRDF